MLKFYWKNGQNNSARSRTRREKNENTATFDIIIGFGAVEKVRIRYFGIKIVGERLIPINTARTEKSVVAAIIYNFQ